MRIVEVLFILEFGLPFSTEVLEACSLHGFDGDGLDESFEVWAFEGYPMVVEKIIVDEPFVSIGSLGVEGGVAKVGAGSFGGRGFLKKSSWGVRTLETFRPSGVFVGDSFMELFDFIELGSSSGLIKDSDKVDVAVVRIKVAVSERTKKV